MIWCWLQLWIWQYYPWILAFTTLHARIEWKRLIEALIKHYKAQKERSNLYSIGSDIQPHEKAQKRNIPVLKQELKRCRWNTEI